MVIIKFRRVVSPIENVERIARQFSIDELSSLRRLFGGEGDFVPNKLYPVLKPVERDPKGHLRIIDESGEDYLYPEVYFQIVQLAPQAKENLLHYFEASAV